MLRALTPLAKEHWPFRWNAQSLLVMYIVHFNLTFVVKFLMLEHWCSKGDGKGIFLRSPKTPPAPRHGPRPPRIKFSEGPQTGSVLFPEPSFSARCMGPSALRKTRFKTIASNRVLFSEDELCHAVAQNTLRWLPLVIFSSHVPLYVQHGFCSVEGLVLVCSTSV